MHIIRFLCTLSLLLVASALPARADINIFLTDLNNRAYAAPNDYSVRLSTQFGLPQPQVHSLIRSVAVPADAFMILQLARMLGLPYERVLPAYNAHRGRGWGVIAKELGIKPGSPEFHALKRGDFALTGVPGGGKGSGGDPGHGGGQGYRDDRGPGEDKGHGKGADKGGKGKGHNK